MNKIIKPNRLSIGDTIGVVAPSNPIINENVDEIEEAKKIVESKGFKVEFSKNVFSNSEGYSATAKEKAEDINEMFANKNIKMIWCAKGGENSNSTFEYLDYELIKRNPKIICGYSDITSICNIIAEKTGLVTFIGTNFKTIATAQTDYAFKESLNRFVKRSLEIGSTQNGESEYATIQEGKVEGQLIGGNLSLIKNLVAGKYNINFDNKILFIEELGFETCPTMASNYLYFMKQNQVFDKIAGLWIGNYEHESKIPLEKIVTDTLEGNYHFPIIKSNNFGHTETNTTIPIGTKAKIDTVKEQKIEFIENCVN